MFWWVCQWLGEERRSGHASPARLTIESCGGWDPLPAVHPTVQQHRRGLATQSALAYLDSEDTSVLVCHSEIEKLHEGISAGYILNTLTSVLSKTGNGKSPWDNSQCFRICGICQAQGNLARPLGQWLNVVFSSVWISADCAAGSVLWWLTPSVPPIWCHSDRSRGCETWTPLTVCTRGHKTSWKVCFVRAGDFFITFSPYYKLEWRYKTFMEYQLTL